MDTWGKTTLPPAYFTIDWSGGPTKPGETDSGYAGTESVAPGQVVEVRSYGLWVADETPPGTYDFQVQIGDGAQGSWTDVFVLEVRP